MDYERELRVEIDMKRKGKMEKMAERRKELL